MPHMNFFLEKKRKHEEEFSQNTLSSVNSTEKEKYQGTPTKIKKQRTHKFKDEDLEIDESLTGSK